MDSNQLTPEMVSKFINGLYKDTYPGFVKEFRVEVINYKKNTKGLYQPDVIIHVLMDNEVYGNTGLPKGKGYLAVKDMEDKIKSILNYLPYPYNLRIVKLDWVFQLLIGQKLLLCQFQQLQNWVMHH